jgi:hypothetical protein
MSPARRDVRCATATWVSRATDSLPFFGVVGDCFIVPAESFQELAPAPMAGGKATGGGEITPSGERRHTIMPELYGDEAQLDAPTTAIKPPLRWWLSNKSDEGWAKRIGCYCV